MVQCFAPDCNHQSEALDCSFFRFPTDSKEKNRWIKLIRRADKVPTSSSRVCSCHFRDGKKLNCPTIFKRNADKLFPVNDHEKPVKKTCISSTITSTEIIPVNQTIPASTLEIPPLAPALPLCLRDESFLLKIEVQHLERKISSLQEEMQRKVNRYSVRDLDSEVICMETCLPDKKIFYTVVSLVERFKHNIQYFAGWKVESHTLDDQIFITMMKLKQNYTNLHLAQLFGCSTSTVRNVVLTFINVLYELLYEGCMSSVPSKEKNQTSLPSAFTFFGNCRMVIDCTDIKIAVPSKMSDQKLTYSSYRGMNSFKFIVGVAPNAVITYVSNLFPGSVSDKAIVEKSNLMEQFQPGDLILADKGFLINDIAPQGVSVNIPPFLETGKFTKNEIKLTKRIAQCRIHVERANERLKNFKILDFIPVHLRCYADRIVKLCAAMVNLQYPLIREIQDTLDLEE